MRPSITLLAAAIALLGTRSAVAPPARDPPNIVIILADDLGYGDLSAYGQQRYRTPRLDRMAAEGRRFTSYYAGSTVCAPSRAALMTGLHTGHAWIRGNGDIPLRTQEVTIAEVLKAAGYRTAVIGKWGLGEADTAGRPDRQGFDEAFGYLHHQHAHRQYTEQLWKNDRFVPVSAETDYANDLFTNAALDFLTRSKNERFFLYLAYTSPHAELRAPKDAIEAFEGRYPETPFANAKADATRPEPPFNRSGGYRSQPTPRAAFAAMVTRLDRDTGRILDHLRSLGLDRRTLVLFTSDNGPHREGGADPEFFDSNGPLRGIKRDLYEGGIRVPMIAWLPGIVPAGTVGETPWAHWDLLPTLAEFARTKATRDLDGLSAATLIRGVHPPATSSRTLYWEFHERGFQQAARRGQWKALRLAPGQPLELYDLSSDPGEQTNLAATRPDIVKTFEDYFLTARTPSERWPGQTAR
jgi:arylsulfatase A